MGFDGWTNIEEVHFLTTYLSYDDDCDGYDDTDGDGVEMTTLIDFLNLSVYIFPSILGKKIE